MYCTNVLIILHKLTEKPNKKCYLINKLSAIVQLQNGYTRIFTGSCIARITEYQLEAERNVRYSDALIIVSINKARF